MSDWWNVTWPILLFLSGPVRVLRREYPIILGQRTDKSSPSKPCFKSQCHGQRV
ncbi:hypothetical protein BDFG_07418 [Blastomyces dermatitidis ATCC 26199]|nr:hypothetical protein BDFG_07418 [Blastomyces dermatitidis ATCC 26199]